jgi:hypothetical protein
MSQTKLGTSACYMYEKSKIYVFEIMYYIRSVRFNEETGNFFSC